ncbi:hypothetical protein PUR61_16165 [Streptomyces sp. BE20]|uniref:hypothetical protein n=1 Tax=Streptomyces sp. BE20 TaxID=3002525 RepID=UPI002E7AA7E7|nr:hypothetical protein [Streptomyces sp. BE20]MEE1823714.1 hypothetical protein [Streptomyces sp. BE20]
MALDERTDPAQIIAWVGNFASRERAVDVWMHLATKAGWQVATASTAPEDPDNGNCGIVEVEGLRYRIRLTPRVRTDLADDEGCTLTWRPVLSHAEWAEPVLEPGNHIPYRGRT